jgi:hypothetical protein
LENKLKFNVSVYVSFLSVCKHTYTWYFLWKSNQAFLFLLSTTWILHNLLPFTLYDRKFLFWKLLAHLFIYLWQFRLLPRWFLSIFKKNIFILMPPTLLFSIQTSLQKFTLFHVAAYSISLLEFLVSV